MKTLTPALAHELQSALLEAFPTRFDVEQFVLFQLGERLERAVVSLSPSSSAVTTSPPTG